MSVLVDISPLQHNTCGDLALQAEIINLYLEDAGVKLALLKPCCMQGNAQAVWDVAHAIRGGSACIGACAVQLAAINIEKAAVGDMDPDSMVGLLDQLNTVFVETTSYLRQYLNNPQD